MRKDLFLEAAFTLFTVDIYINKSLGLQRKKWGKYENMSHLLQKKDR
jgi:hypothetical protein